jgi:hypothetical protein
MITFTEPNDLTDWEKVILTQIHIERCARLLLEEELKNNPKLDQELFIFIKKHELEQEFIKFPTDIPIDQDWLARIRSR